MRWISHGFSIALGFDCAAAVFVTATLGIILSSSESTPARRIKDSSGLAFVQIPIEGSVMDGMASARGIVMIFSDYQCAYCAHFARTILPLLRKELVESGEASLAFRQFPLDSMHPRVHGLLPRRGRLHSHRRLFQLVL